ncbi:MAG: hypothetical protein ACE5IZ_04345, partial [Dehalococcoidia bacterium]
MRRWVSWLLVGLIGVWLLLVGHPFTAQGEPTEDGDLPPEVLLSLRDRKPPPKIGSALYSLWQADQQEGVDSAQAVSGDPGLLMVNGLVQVEVEAVDGQAEAALAAIEAHGGRLEMSYGRWLQALVPVDELLALSQEEAVEWVRQPTPMVPLGTVSEGLPIIGAPTWQDAGWTGSGVKVGVIDRFAHFELLLGDELPLSPNVVFRSFTNPFSTISRHGAAVAEVVHDIAPGAQLYLAEVNTNVETLNAAVWMEAQGVQIINHSRGATGAGPGDGTGPYNEALSEVINRSDILW